MPIQGNETDYASMSRTDPYVANTPWIDSNGFLKVSAGLVDTAEVTSYITAVNAARSSLSDFSAAQTLELQNFSRALKGVSTTNYPNAADVWSDLRVLAVLDETFGVGEGTVIIPVISDDGSGSAVGADDASQERGTMQGSAPWDDFHSSSQYAEIPVPQTSFDWETYTICALLDSGAASGVNTLLSLEVTGEAYNTAGTSEFRWFASDRLDGHGVANVFPQTVNSSYSLQQMAIVRTSLSRFDCIRNGYRRVNASTRSAASTPDFIWAGHQAGLGSPSRPYSVALFDRVLTDAELTSVFESLDRLRVSQKTGGALLIEENGTDVLLAEDSTTDQLLLEAS